MLILDIDLKPFSCWNIPLIVMCPEIFFLCHAENKVRAHHVSPWPVRVQFLWPLHLSEQAGIVNEVAFSWILTSLSAGLPHTLIGAIGLGLRPDRGEAEKGENE